MTYLKKFSLVATFTASALLSSAAYADTVGCHKYKSYYSHDDKHWNKVVEGLEQWVSKHDEHHPYYYSIKKQLVQAEYKKKYRHKYHHDCKHDVSPS